MDFTRILSERLSEMLRSFVETLPNIGMALLVLLLTWGVVRITLLVLEKTLKRSSVRRSLKLFFKKSAGIAIWTIGIITAAVVAFPSVTPGKLISALGLGSIAVGFAFKDIFENFIAGMLILLREPFRLGDYVECEDIAGFVRDITIRDTRVEEVTGEMVTLPNAMLFKNPVEVKTANERRRITIFCGVAYDEDVAESRRVIHDAVASVEKVSGDHPIQIFANEFADSSINFEIAWWWDSDPLSVRESRDQVIEAVKSALDDAGIEIPFPYRTLTFKEALSLERQAED